ncbi:hypothetical protein T310_6252 [Rasamsonia emersonii CBS 393.64]|uniref:Reticulon-like protein n=1 Tax=Rasamsonia emersonii (strain ATCC 16479 / CBS 393.64 / IMI 116815) TaxID=1408163 RepID=A0A0F4YNU6_RASE3|nr:hypothetical protein T310_6252 [Rasamsonia emersonii CBS 393.64]KKA19760.1 hypothetical protein T310_6252 [Rasamsonia emersonii CBS 393.64]
MAEPSGDVSYPVVNGANPASDGVKTEASKPGDELRRVTPSQTTSTGQPLTPMAALEVAGKLVFSQGLASSFRPRKYYTIPKETIEGVLDDLEQLFDFFLLEFQRTLFAENVIHTIAAFSAAFVSYWLSKILPLWGLALIAVTIAYLGPLVYISNREIIDEQIHSVQQLINAQASHVRGIAEQHTAHATGLVKQYASDYSAKAQGYIRRSATPEVAKAPASGTTIKTEPVSPQPSFKQSDFPEAPKTEPVAAEPAAESSAPENNQEPLLAL